MKSERRTMESSAGTLGKFYVGDGVSARSICISSGIHISLKNVSTFESWEHQKTDFIRGHGIVHSCITDEMFVVHLLEVHAQFCADSLCKCRCFSRGHRDALLEYEADCEADVRKGPSEVDSNLEGTENDRLLGVVMESPDVSHDQKMNVVAVEIKVEEETSEDDGGDHVDAESYFWLNSEATRGRESKLHKMQKLELRGMPDKCEVCHKALQGSSSQYSLHSVDLNRCDGCREGEVTGNRMQAMNTEADISLQTSCHPTRYGSRTCKVKSEVSDDIQEGENMSLAGKSIPCSNLEEWTGEQPCQEGETEIIDYQTNGNTTVAGKSIPSSNLGESTEVQAHREAETGTRRSMIHQGIQTVEQPSGCRNCLQGFSRDRDLVRQQPNREGLTSACSSRIYPGVQTLEKPFGCRNSPQNSSKKHAQVRQQAPQEVVTCTCSLRNPGGQKVEKQRYHRGFSQKHDLIRKQALQEGVTGTCSSMNPGVQAVEIPVGSRDHSQSSSQNRDLVRQRAHQEGVTRTYSSTIVPEERLENPCGSRTCPQSFSREHDLERKQGKRECVTGTYSSRNPGVQIAEKPVGSRNHSQSSSQKHELVRRSRAHNGERPPFSCNMCDQSFFLEINLKNHMEEQSCEGLFSGSICPKRSSLADDLESTYIVEKPFSCSRCAKTFATKPYLRKHMNIHEGKKQLTCRFCQKSFGQKHDLIRHIRSHTGERPFKCNKCNKAYSRKIRLKDHMKKHSGKAYWPIQWQHLPK